MGGVFIQNPLFFQLFIIVSEKKFIPGLWTGRAGTHFLYGAAF